MKYLFLILQYGPSMFWYYIKISKSFDFMIRYMGLAIFHIIDVITLRKIQWLYVWYCRIITKDFVFKTEYGIFLGRNINQWTVLHPFYEPSVRKVIVQNYEKNKNKVDRIFIDIGAHTGRYVVELANKYGYTSYGFEPSFGTFEVLKINTILSGATNNTRIFNYGLGIREELVEFEYTPENDGSSKVITTKDTNKMYSQVQIKKGDDVITTDIIEKIALILIDVEGFENNVLRGMENVLTSIKDADIIVEILPETTNKADTLAYMGNLGFTWTEIDPVNIWFKKQQ